MYIVVALSCLSLQDVSADQFFSMSPLEFDRGEAQLSLEMERIPDEPTSPKLVLKSTVICLMVMHPRQLMLLNYIRLYTISNPPQSNVAVSARDAADWIVAAKNAYKRLNRQFPDRQSFEHLLEELPEDNVFHSIVSPRMLALVIGLLYLQTVSWEVQFVLPEFVLSSKVIQPKLVYLHDHLLTNFRKNHVSHFLKVIQDTHSYWSSLFLYIMKSYGYNFSRQAKNSHLRNRFSGPCMERCLEWKFPKRSWLYTTI